MQDRRLIREHVSDLLRVHFEAATTRAAPDLAHHRSSRVAAQRAHVGGRQRGFLTFSGEVIDRPRKADQAKRLPRGDQVPVSLVAIVDRLDRPGVAARNALIRAGAQRAKGTLCGECAFGLIGGGALLLGRFAEHLGAVFRQVCGDQQHVAAESFRAEPGMHRLRMHVTAERAYGNPPVRGILALSREDAGGRASGLARVDDHTEFAGTAVGVDVEALSRIGLTPAGGRTRMAEPQLAHEREPVSAFLARQRRCPQVAPGVGVIVPWVELGHAGGVPAARLGEEGFHVRAQLVICDRVAAVSLEGKRRFGAPVLEWDLCQQGTAEGGERRVVDAFGVHPEAAGFQRDHGSPRERVEHLGAARISGAQRVADRGDSVADVRGAHRRSRASADYRPHRLLELLLVPFVFRPRQQARQHGRLSLGCRPLGEPHPQAGLGVSAAPPRHRRVAHLGAREPAFDHAGHGTSWPGIGSAAPALTANSSEHDRWATASPWTIPGKTSSGLVKIPNSEPLPSWQDSTTYRT